MNKFHFLVIIIIVTLSSVYAQDIRQITSPTFRQITLNIQPDSLIYKLPDKNIMNVSDLVYCENTLLKRDIDYKLNYAQGIVEFLPTANLSQSVFISYNIIPDFLLQKMYLYELRNIRDSLATFQNIRKPLFQQNDTKLLISGTKTFSLSFSNQESFDLKQSLFLKLEGEISNNMKIEGQLSDSQSPLSPEGDSREISSLDQVYLKLYGRQYEIVFGDQEWQFKDTALMNYQARFEGINLSYHDKFAIQAALAANGGKSTVNIFQGIDGKQGPYYLTAMALQQNVQVVPGSERISINGANLSRGTDYAIDYDGGSITFKILITSNSRIVADFQYTDDYYSQNLYLNSSVINLSPALKLQHHVIWQKDDRNNPLQWTFSASDKDSLRHAGDRNVWGQGVIDVGAGKGQYIRKTTPENIIYYEYVQGDTTASYDIYFSYLGYQQGDYEPIPLNPSKYEFKGQGLGSWMPYKRLIAPTNKSNIGLDLSYNSPAFDVSLEGMVTNQDKNTFSKLNDNDNTSLITSSKLAYHPPDLKLNPMLSLRYQQRLKDSFAFSNLTPSEESFEYSSLPPVDSLAQTQVDLNGQLSNPAIWKQIISLRYKKVESEYLQKAIKSNTEFYQTGLIPSLNWYGIYSQQAFTDTVMTNSVLNYHNVISSWKWKMLMLKFNYLLQQNSFTYKDNTIIGTVDGNRFQKLNPALKIGDEKSYSSEINYTEDKNDLKIDSHWNTQQASDTWQYSQMINSVNNTLNLNYIHREVTQSPADSLHSDKKNYDLFDLKSSHQFWDNSISFLTAYQINQLEFYPQVRELQYIGDGLGLYDSTGVQISGGDFDYIYTNSGQSKLSTEVTANANMFLHLSQKYYKGKFWNRFRLDSGFQITENTSQKNNYKVYLLYPDQIFQDGSTIFGRQAMQHTLWYDILKNVVTGNLRYEINRTLDNRYQSQSKTYQDEKSVELDWQKILGSKIQTSYQLSLDRDTRYNSEIRNRLLDVVIFRNINPSTTTQWTFSYARETGKTQSQANEYIITNFKVNPSVSWYPNRKYRLTSNLLAQRNQRSGSTYLSFLPEKRNGSIFVWSMQAQYKLNSFSSGSLEYSGKSYPGEDILHELKMEFRAEL